MKVSVRPATVEDAESIVRAHYSAVHKTAARDYPQDILDEWSPAVTAERIGKFESLVRDNPENEVIVVAEIDGKVIGFGSIVPAKNELRAVYVSGDAGSSGAGRAIVEYLELQARKLNVTELNLDSSINAEAFYAKLGYEAIGKGKHPMRSGRLMDCVRMRKQFENHK